MEIRKIIYIGVLVSQALVLYIFESFIPVPFFIPGAKLGLANLVVVIAIYTLGSYRECILLILLKLVLSTLLMGSLSTFIFGVGGTALSFIAMILVKRILNDKVSAIGISTIGGVFHNIGQLLVASLVIKNIALMAYLPFLSLTGIGTGIFIGISANFLLKHMKRINDFSLNKNIF